MKKRTKRISDRIIDHLNFGMFEGSCLFVCGFSYEQTLKHLQKKEDTEWIEMFKNTKDVWDNDNWGFCSKRWSKDDKKYYFLVIKKQFNFSDDSQRKLAHEIVHLASFYLKDLLDPMQENEAFAYFHTYLMKQCHDILRG